MLDYDKQNSLSDQTGEWTIFKKGKPASIKLKMDDERRLSFSHLQAAQEAIYVLQKFFNLNFVKSTDRDFLIAYGDMC